MTQTKHTPGPWNIFHHKYAICYDARHKDEDLIYYSVGAQGDLPVAKCAFPDTDNLANARLIAAAPDGLEIAQELRPLIAYLGEGQPNNEFDEMLGPKLPGLLKKLDTFIAKATSFTA